MYHSPKCIGVTFTETNTVKSIDCFTTNTEVIGIDKESYPTCRHVLQESYSTCRHVLQESYSTCRHVSQCPSNNH